MSSPIEQLLNKIIANMLPTINSGIQRTITSNHLDPWGQVANGSDNLGSIDLGICDASANASYYVGNLQGLRSFAINSIVISSIQTDPQDPSKLNGAISLSASLSANLSASVGGEFEAKCGFIHPSVGISGSAVVSGVSGGASGSFSASVNGSQVCLNSMTISALDINYSNISVNIDGLGIFNTFLSPLTSLIIGLFNGQIKGAISSALKPVLNTQANNALPQCQSL